MCVNGTSASPGGFRGLFTRTRATFPSVERALSPFRITLNFLRTPRGSRETNEIKTRVRERRAWGNNDMMCLCGSIRNRNPNSATQRNRTFFQTPSEPA